jgi:polyphosphate kinase
VESVVEDVNDSSADGEGAPEREPDKWLALTKRLLARAEDTSIDTLRRVEFVARTASHLDAFFMVRIGRIKDPRTPALQGPGQETRPLLAGARSVAQRHGLVFGQELLPALSERGIHLRRVHELSEAQRSRLDNFFMRAVFPVVTPMSVDPGRPFPHISNLSLNIAALVRGRRSRQRRFARIKVPGHLPRFLQLADEPVFVGVEDCIATNLDHLFVGAEVLEHHAFRVTRSLDFDVDDGSKEFLIEAPEVEWHRRSSSTAVRLEVEAGMPAELVEFLVERLGLDPEAAYPVPGPLDLSAVSSLCSSGKGPQHALTRPRTPRLLLR